MSTQVDERVVEMRFDNKQFEQETKRTFRTLSKLKEALKIPGAEKSLQNIDKAARNIHLEGIAAGVELLTKRFSAFGIASMQIIQNVTNALTSKLAAAVNFVSDAIVSGGIKRAMNIENAHFQLQALLKDEVKVQAVMDNAMESVDGTAYAYDEAAKAASMFAASGLQAGEEMLQALKGITGVAAMTNSDFESMAMIFTTVAGNGRLMGDQLLQLSSRGMNAAATIADYFREVQGQADVTEGTIREMVTDGEISFKIFSDAMTWAFGDSAKRANETFTGAMSNMKSALARIGAGFVSPLIEQNGEMVNLFNALRIKINEVKSALVFDEQTSAISGMAEQANVMVQTVANLTKEGKINFDMFTSAILGAGKSEEELAEINGKLAVTFGDIAESGYASNEALLSIKNNGIDVYDALVKYINGVADGTIKATGQLKASVRELTEGTEVSRASVIRFANEGRISFDIFNNSIVNYSGLVQKEGKATSAALKAMLTSVKDTGSVTNEILKDFRNNGLNATHALVKYINGVADGTIRATYATKKEIDELTGGMKVSIKDIHRFADEGKISFNTFQSAMEKSFGNSKTLSKQVTDYILDTLKSLVKYVNNIDVSKPMEAFYNSFNSIKNIAGGVISAIKPVTAAFNNVFKGISVDAVVTITGKIEELTSKFKLSETGSENLEKAFTGVFDIIKVLIDIVGKFISALNPSFKPIEDLGEGALGVAGSMGAWLSKFAEWLNTSPAVNATIETLASLVKAAVDKIKEFTGWISKSFTEIKKSPITKKVLDNLSKGFKTLATNVKEFIKSFGNGLKEIPKFFSDLFGGNSSDDVDGMKDGLGELQGAADSLNFDKPISAFEKLKNAAAKLGEILMGNKGINVFVTNINEFFDRMIDAFQAETLETRINMVTTTLDKFIDWTKKHLKPLFQDVTVGGVISAGSGIGMIYSILRMAKAFEGVANKIKAIPDMLGPIKSTLTAYQEDLKASQLIKIAGAIAILAGALTVMSFADWDQIWKSAIALGAVAGVVLWASGKFLGAISKAKEIPDVLHQLSLGISTGLKQLGRAVEIKALGSTIKDLGKTLVLLVVSLAGIVLMVKKDPNNFYEALDIVKNIGLVVAGIATVLLFISGVVPTSLSLKTAGISSVILSIAGSLYIIIGALKKLFSMEIPERDWKRRLLILGDVLKDLALLAASLIFTNIFAGFAGAGGLGAAAPFLGVVGAMYLAILALQKLFKLEIPSDAQDKIKKMKDILWEFALVLSVVSVVSKFTGGFGNDSGKTLLGLAAVLMALAWSVEKLSDIQGRKLARAVVAMDGVIIALALVFSHMDGIGGEKDTGKSVLYMAAVIGAIAVSLGVLSMIPMDLLAKSCAALGSILVALALDFSKISKITNEASWKSVLSMVVMTIAITAELMFLSEQPWDGLLAGAGGLSMVLLAMAGAFKIVSDATVIYDKETFAMFASLIAASAAITVELMFLSNQPWAGLLAGGTALSEVLLAMAGAFKIIADCDVKYDEETFAMFASLIVASGVITVELMFLSEQPWDGLLAGATALSEVLLAMAGVMAILVKVHANVKTATDAALAFDAFVAIIAALLAAFAGIDFLVKEASGGKYSLEDLIATGSGVLSKIGLALGDFVGSVIGGIGSGITSALPKMGEDLGAFMDNSKSFWPALAQVDKDATEAVKNLAAMILMITAADVLDGIFVFFTKGMSLAAFGEELKKFGPHLAEFADSVKDVDAAKVQGAASAAQIMAEMAQKLPKISGLGVLIFGVNKNLSDFGAELKAFGPDLAEFADSVKDITPEAVEGAASAAAIMAALYDDLPTIGGLSTLIFGAHKNLSDFGDELKEFAPDLAEFADSVKDITPEAVEGAASAAEMLATLANEMPSTDTLWEKIFGGGTVSLDTFSSDLITFGENMVSFSEKLADFEDTNVQAVVDSFKALVDLAKYIDETGTDASPITAFANSLKFMAVNAIEGFVDGFEESDEKAITAVGEFMKTVTDSVYESADSMRTNSAFLGKTMAIAVADGIRDNESLVTQRIKELARNMLATLETSVIASTFSRITQDALAGISNAIVSKKITISASIRELSYSMISTLRTGLPQSTFSQIGQNAFQGVYNGINSRRTSIKTLIQTISNQIVAAARTGLQSSKFTTTGGNIIQGIITGVTNKKSSALNTVRSFCRDIISAMNRALTRTSFVTMGANIAANLISGINSQADEVQKAAQNLIDIANQTMAGVAETINDQMDAVTKSTQETMKEVTNTIKNSKPNQAAQNVGKNTSKGVSVGIKNGKKTVVNAARDVALAVPEEMQRVLKIQSPSRVAAELGEYISIGLAEGIANKEPEVTEAVDNIVKAILSSLTQLMTMEYGEQISICLADGISNQQSAIEDAIDRIIKSVEQKIEDLKEYINNTMEAIENEYFAVEPDIKPSWDLDDVDGILGDTAVEGLPGDIIGDDFKHDNVIDGDYNVIIGEGVVEPIIGEAAKEFETVIGSAIQEGFSEAIGSTISNAHQVQSIIKNYGEGIMSSEPAREYEKVLGDSMQELAEAITETRRVPPNNTFYISGNDPQEIAVEVSRILQHQVERTEKTWA